MRGYVLYNLDGKMVSTIAVRKDDDEGIRRLIKNTGLEPLKGWYKRIHNTIIFKVSALESAIYVIKKVSTKTK